MEIKGSITPWKPVEDEIKEMWQEYTDLIGRGVKRNQAFVLAGSYLSGHNIEIDPDRVNARLYPSDNIK